LGWLTIFDQVALADVALLALNGDAPGYSHDLGAALAALSVPAFACIPGACPGLMAAAIERRDIAAWAAARSPS
jgi:hypothetical protein